jgi:subtilisin
MRRWILLGISAAVACTLPIAAPASAAETETRLLVAVSDESAVNDVAALAEDAGANVEAQISAASAVAVTATPTEAARIAAADDVVAVIPDIPLRPTLAQSTNLVGSKTVNNSGYDGSGRAVVVIDTGVQSDHAFLDGRVVNGACFSAGNDCPNHQDAQVGLAAGEPCTFSEDCFHGTHVAGIVAGHNDSFSGVAPDASILSINVATASDEYECGGEPCLEIWTSDMMYALEQAYEWHDEYDIAAVNMSLGGGLFSGANCNSISAAPYVKPLIDDLRSVGIPTVVAAGNDGSSSKIAFPACLSSAIAVGATMKSDRVASYSDASAALDVLAPGSSITSSAPEAIFDSGYAVASGTSMAAPHVAGAFAVVDELLPSAPLATKQYRITKTGPKIKDSRNNLVRHRLKLSADITPPQTSITKKPAATVRVAKVTFTFTGGSTWECKVDAKPYAPCSSGISVTAAKGTHTFKVRARDAAGNQDATPATTTWRRT